MAFRWDRSPEQVFVQGYANHVQATKQEAISIFEAAKPEILDWMKENKSWNDETGETTASLNVNVKANSDSIMVIISSNSEAGEFIETTPFGIIIPTIRFWGVELMKRLRR